MGFNSFNFILIFMPVLLVIWLLLNRAEKIALADIFLTLMSLYYYYTFGTSFLLILLVSIVVNYALSFLMEKRKDYVNQFAVVGVIFNLALLFYFKYLGFFLDNINHIVNGNFSLKEVLMPIGISFFTFGQISFIVDRSKGEAPHYPFLKYAMYTVYFPKLIQGPIAFHKEMIDQFKDKSLRRFDPDTFAKGIMSFIIGLGKKVILADTLALSVNYGFHYTYFLDTLTVIAVMLAYTFQIYLDFSGYCDMASGISMMLGFKLPVNFNSPYKAATAKELWQRWHMTLSRFFIKYVYIPLGGSRKGKIRKYINTLIIFAASGLWHGAAWTYVIWGLLSGIFQVSGYILKPFREFIIGKIPFKGGFAAKSRKILSSLFTFILFLISLVFFKSTTIESAIEIERKIFTEFDLSTVFSTSFFSLGLGSLNFMILLISLFLLLAYDILNERTGDAAANILKLTKTKRWAIYYLLTLMIIGSANIGAAQFIYFDF